jgi:hypothetical protein
MVVYHSAWRLRRLRRSRYNRHKLTGYQRTATSANYGSRRFNYPWGPATASQCIVAAAVYTGPG